jgi:ADP-ribose pyrophosphatase YjhB (NUDIX family)
MDLFDVLRQPAQRSACFDRMNVFSFEFQLSLNSTANWEIAEDIIKRNSCETQMLELHRHPNCKLVFGGGGIIKQSVFACERVKMSSVSVDELAHEVDIYNGIIVAINPLKILSIEDFTNKLNFSVAKWREEGRAGIWLKIPIENIELISVAVRVHGFELHHAQVGYVMLTKWLQNGPSTLPHYCSTHLGVGGIVFNKAGEVLVITEKKGPAAQEGFWKFPGGAADPGEDLTVATEREVFEETGVKVKFVKILTMRHLLNFRFDRADFYCLCLCALEDDNPEIKMQESEISACMWMPLEEFLELKHIKSRFQHLEPAIRAAAEEIRTGKPSPFGFSAEPVKNRFSGKEDLWYLNKVQPQ